MYHPTPPLISLAQGDIHLWLIDDQEVTVSGVIHRFPALLSDEENDRMQTFRSSRRKRQFLITRAALRSLLCNYLPDSSPKTLRFEKNAYGKPTLSGNTQDIQFNLSHSQNKVLIGVTRKRWLGVDIESMSGQRNIRTIADHYFHPREWNADLLQQDANSGADTTARFYKLWTLKEAFIKAEGKGLVIPTDAFYFSDLQSSQPELVVTATDFCPAKRWHFTHQFISDDYSLALAYENFVQTSSVRIQLNRFVPLSDTPFEALTERN